MGLLSLLCFPFTCCWDTDNYCVARGCKGCHSCCFGRRWCAAFFLIAHITIAIVFAASAAEYSRFFDKVPVDGGCSVQNSTMITPIGELNHHRNINLMATHHSQLEEPSSGYLPSKSTATRFQKQLNMLGGRKKGMTSFVPMKSGSYSSSVYIGPSFRYYYYPVMFFGGTRRRVVRNPSPDPVGVVSVQYRTQDGAIVNATGTNEFSSLNAQSLVSKYVKGQTYNCWVIKGGDDWEIFFDDTIPGGFSTNLVFCAFFFLCFAVGFISHFFCRRGNYIDCKANIKNESYKSASYNPHNFGNAEMMGFSAANNNGYNNGYDNGALANNNLYNSGYDNAPVDINGSGPPAYNPYGTPNHLTAAV